MLNLSRSILNQQSCITRIITELVTEKSAVCKIQQIVLRLKNDNEAEHKRLSAWQIRRMLAQAIIQENPNLSREKVETLLKRRLEAAMKPHQGSAMATSSATAKDMERRSRRGSVKQGRQNRR